MNDLSKLPTTEGAAKVAAPFHYPDSAMTPLERYQADLKRPDFFHDAAQENAVRHLQRLYDDLVADDRSKSGLLGKLFGKKQQGPIKGIYFWAASAAARPTWWIPSSTRCLSSRRCARISTAS